MAARIADAVLPRDSALQRDEGRTARGFDPATVTAGLAYVSRCLRGHRPFGIVTGLTGGLGSFVARVTADCEAHEDLHTVRLTVPTDSVQDFLANCLGQLGFELRQAALDDLHNLMVVFLRHESTRGRRTVVIVEGTDECGPHVLEFMETLSKVRAGATPAMTFILTGSPDLHRILDSDGMSGLRQFTRERFDLDRSLAWIATTGKPAAATGPWSGSQQTGRQHLVRGTAPRRLLVLLDGEIVDQRVLNPGRMLIGRSPQCDLRLDSRFVSRHHAGLVITDTAVALVDLQSTNSTLVNGRVTASKQLENGDLLTIGNFRLRFDCRPR